MKNSIWTIISRIVIILTGIVTMITLIGLLSNKIGNRVEATLYRSDYIEARNQSNYRQILEEEINYNKFEEKILEYLDKGEKNEMDNYDKFLLSKKVSEIILNDIHEKLMLDSLFSNIWNNYPDYKYMLKIEIKNKGNKKLDNIKIIIPVKGEYRIKYSKDKYEFEDFINDIEIGELYPKQNLEILIWTNDYYSSSDESIVTYANGAKKIKEAEYISGFYLILYNFKYMLFPIIFIIIFLMLMINLEKNKNNDSSEEEESQPNQSDVDIEEIKEK